MTEEAVTSDIAATDDDTLTQDEREDLEETSSHVSRIVYSSQDFDVDGLVRRVKQGDIVIPRFGSSSEDIETAGFQRGFVWRRPQMDKFIESLLLGFPIPGVFFVRQKDKRYLVLDGQQRLETLRAFYDGKHAGQLFILKHVSDEFKGLSYEELEPSARRLIDNAFIQATVVDTDGTSKSLNSVYQIFERLNSGGTQLTAHEIRIALYAGGIVAFLEDINRQAEWRKLYGPRSSRLRDQELILRIIALFLRADEYSRPLKGFLNDFMADYRRAEGSDLTEAATLLRKAADLLLQGPGPESLRKNSRQVNAAQSEAIFVGLMRRIKSADPDISPAQVSEAVKILREDEQFDDATGFSTADPFTVDSRLEIATAKFAEI